MPPDDDASPNTPEAVPPPPPPPPPPLGAEPPSARRRRQRSWSPPSSTPKAEFERPLTERDWSRDRPKTPATPPPVTPAPAAPASAGRAAVPTAAPTRPPIGADVVAAVAELKTGVAAMRDELHTREAARDATLVTGTELAASIDALGTTLGTGLAALLTEHRSLLARDLDAATDRILDEVGERLRATGAQTVESVEERARHVTAKAVGDLSAALELRLDQLEADLSGLRAVMLEIPDQTQVLDRLEQLGDSMGSGDGARPGRGGGGGDDAHLERLDALAKEMAALRRRIALRPDLLTDSGAAEDDEVPPPPPPRPVRTARTAKAPLKAATKAATRKAAPAKKAAPKRAR
jgi:hypothetical protein